MSHSNLILYSSVLPTYDSKKEGDKKVINADDPNNREEIKKELYG